MSVLLVLAVICRQVLCHRPHPHPMRGPFSLLLCMKWMDRWTLGLEMQAVACPENLTQPHLCFLLHLQKSGSLPESGRDSGWSNG